MKIRNIFLFIGSLFLAPQYIFSQTSIYHRYIIEFRDKEGNPFSVTEPSDFLSQRAIDRRSRYNIPITSNDLPVNPGYIQQVSDIGVKLINKSKWLNSISIETDDSLLLVAVNNLSFVKSAYPIAPRHSFTHRDPKTISDVNFPKLSGEELFEYGSATNQIEMLHGTKLHQQGYKGEGMIIAVLDIGFINVPVIPLFDKLNQEGRILGKWNFVKGNDSVYNFGGHGTSVLSTIAANNPGTMVGTAPGVSVYLFVTEDGESEYPIEEHNWAAAAEMADSLGADMITTSLGYSLFNDPSFDHTYEQMDGNTTMITRAADFAAGKGMIVCSSAGNEGNHDWYYITAPADGDSVLTVGAVDSVGLLTSFSSHGPASDGDVKPNVVAQGIRATVVEPFSGTVVTSSGTSFSNPIIAGMTACLWQAHPDKNNMEIISAIEKSASLYYNPNDSMGFGIPNYEVADLMLSAKAPDELDLTGALIYPNPFTSNVGMLYYTARLQEVDIEIFNVYGEKVQFFKSTFQAGYNFLPITALQYAPNGIYILRLNFDDHHELVQLVKTQP